MHAVTKIIVLILAALTGYAAGAIGGGLLTSVLSQNKHDKSVEAAMTGAFVIGPVVAIIAFCLALWFTKNR